MPSMKIRIRKCAYIRKLYRKYQQSAFFLKKQQCCAVACRHADIHFPHSNHLVPGTCTIRTNSQDSWGVSLEQWFRQLLVRGVQGLIPVVLGSLSSFSGTYFWIFNIISSCVSIDGVCGFPVHTMDFVQMPNINFFPGFWALEYHGEEGSGPMSNDRCLSIWTLQESTNLYLTDRFGCAFTVSTSYISRCSGLNW